MSTQELLEAACHDHSIVVFHNNYSGRGMFGRTCVGIVGSMSDCMCVIASVIKEAASDRDISLDYTVDTLLDFSQDSMGRDVILFWPLLGSIEEVLEEPES